MKLNRSPMWYPVCAGYMDWNKPEILSADARITAIWSGVLRESGRNRYIFRAEAEADILKIELVVDNSLMSNYSIICYIVQYKIITDTTYI